jgi:signal transduction histidine kinase/CheY-like chemotaxis protein
MDIVETKRLWRGRWLVGLLVGILAAACASAQSHISLQQAGSREGRDFTPVYEGREVVVSGQVNSRPVLAADVYYLAIQDATWFGLLMQGAESRFHDFEPGDWVEATGTLLRRGGRPVLLPREIHRLGHTAPPAPKKLTVPELTSFRYLGVLVTTDSVVADRDQNAGGDLLVIGQKAKGLSVFLPRARRDSGPQLAGFRTGDRVRVIGIASQYCTLPPYDQYFQILVAAPSAVAVLERSWMIQPPVLLAALILAAALLGIWWIRERRMASLRKQMHKLNGLGEEVIGATSPAEILRRLTLTLPALTGASNIGLYIQNRGAKVLETVHSTGAADSVDLTAPEAGLAAAIAACHSTRTLVAIPDARRSPFFRGLQSDRIPRSMLLVPMLAQSELVGVLELSRSEGFHYFGRNEQAAMQHLANQVAAALKLQEQHTMREQLFRSEKLAAAGQLISDVADELRSPLESIVRLASELGSRQPEEKREELESISDEARRASQIVARLVSFGKVEQSEVEPVELNGMLSDLLKFRAPEWKVKGVEILSQFSPKRATVMGSAGQLEQVLLNLLVDAEKSAAEAREKTIAVSTSLLAKRVLVEILYPTRSSEFHRADSTDGELVGSGALGLGVCRGIIQSHSGEFRVVQVSPTQARFDVELPVVETRHSGSGPGSQLGEAGRQLTVLVLEPDHKVQRQLVQLLGARGDRVVPISSADEAIEMVQRLRFDIVICAVRLPGVNWVQFYERVRRQIGGFVLVTDGFNNDLARAFRAGQGFTLGKPIDEIELYRICRIIEERAAVNS